MLSSTACPRNCAKLPGIATPIFSRNFTTQAINMNLYTAADTYIKRITSKKGHAQSLLARSRANVLLLDETTTPIISMVATQSDLLQHDIYLIERLETPRDQMRHLKCVCFVSCGETSIAKLVKELHDPLYSEYELYFNSALTKSQLERLAEADKLEVVTKVEEIFLDFMVLDSQFFQCSETSLLTPLLALKLWPKIRGLQGLGDSIDKQLRRIDMKFPVPDVPPLLLLLDRSFDLVTPLLQPWTYQSMVHEYIGIKNNTVAVATDDGEKVLLSKRQDAFYGETMFLNFGELSDKVKEYVNNYKQQHSSSGKLDSIDDIKKFIEVYPEFKKLSGNVVKHMAIVSELDKQLNENKVWETSEMEQNMATHGVSIEELGAMLQRPDIPSLAKQRLGALCAVIQPQMVQRVTQILSGLGIDTTPVANIAKLGTAPPVTNKTGLFAAKADNIYMQHEPVLAQILDKLSKGKLTERECPWVGAKTTDLPQDVVVYIRGGVTYEEARIVAKFNAQHHSMRVVLGGDGVVSTKQFLDKLF